MKKRNKKYNGKQVVKQKVHKFQMTWEVNEAKSIIELHHLLNGVDPQESTHTPLKVWMKAHKGDLALALKTHTIPESKVFISLVVFMRLMKRQAKRLIVNFSWLPIPLCICGSS